MKSPSKDEDDESQPAAEPSAAAAPAPALSSFGFMNVGAPEPAPATPAPAVSSFSFLNPTSPEPSSTTPPPAAAAAAPAASGFSFMMQDSTTATTEPAAEASPPPAAAPTSGFSFMVQESTTEPAVEESPPDVAAPPSPVVSSGFDFMQSMGSPDVTEAAASAPVVEETIIPTIAEEAPAATGGFWSLSEPLDGSSAAPPKTIHTRTNSVSSASSALSNPSLPPVPTPTPTQTGGIAGAGITFGTSSAKPRVKKKKKSRAAKVGVGANYNETPTAVATPPPAPVPAPAPAAPPAAAPEVPSYGAAEETKSARDAALEASNRAEAFMQAKAMEEARATSTTPEVSPADLEIRPTESTDEVLAAAKEAAEQAKAMQHQQKGKGGGFMGTFFKGFRPTTSMTSTSSMGNSSKHSVSSQSVGSNSSATAMDRVAKEQQAMKQAMAKRELEQQKEQNVFRKPSTSQSEDEDDDMVVVTTSAGTYTPAAVAPTEYNSVAATADSISKTTISEGSAFVPASIPPTPTQKSAFGFQVPVYGQPQQTVVEPVALKPKLNDTPKQKFEHHQEYFSDAVNRAMKKVEDARSLKKGLLEERFVALAKDRFATREIEQIEELLQAAIEEEDYEQADELGQKLDAHKREKSEVENMLANNKQALENLESENTSLGALVVSCFEDLALRLDALKKTELESEKKDDHETLTQYESISKQLSAEHERLQQDLKHLERDEQLVGEEKKELEDSIQDQTGEIEIQKEEANSKLTEVEDEIEELRRLVQMKQQEAADLRTQIFGFEDSISKVRVKFSRQLTRVDKKEIAVKESRREWETENEQHKRQKDAHDIQVQAHSDTLLAHEELLKTLDSELKLSKDFSEIIPTFMEEESESEDEGSLAQLKANVVKCEGAIDVAKKTLKMASMTIQSLQNERDMLVARIPELETRKKAAAAGRDFKAAGKFSKEIKEANARIQECEDDLSGDAKSKKASAEEELRQLDLELIEAKEIADASEKESGLKRMEILAKKISQLVEEKIEKCGESQSEGNNVKNVAARVIEGQIMILKAEGFELGCKYGGWDELMKSIGLDAETENVVNEPVSTPEQEDGEEKPSGGLTSEERLEKAKELLAACAEIEAKVQVAAENEDFEAAGELQQILDEINTEIEELNITDEECLLLAEADTTLDAVPPEQPEEEQCELTDEERLTKAVELIAKQSDLEQKVEKAVEEEDYEAADNLQSSLDQVIADLAELNITDEEREALVTDETSADVVSPAQEDTADVVSPAQEDSEETIVADEKEEEKKEVDEVPTSDLDEEKLQNGEDSFPEKEDSQNVEEENEEAIAEEQPELVEAEE